MNDAVAAFALHTALGVAEGLALVAGVFFLSLTIGFGLMFGAMEGYRRSPYLFGIMVRITNLPDIGFGPFPAPAPPTPPPPAPPPPAPPPDLGENGHGQKDDNSPWNA